LLRLAAIGSLLALVASIAIARGLSAPLSALAEAATAIGRGELGRRVPERGTDETRQLARAFNTMADDLERGEEKRRALVADVAHELRTPLTVLQGNLQAILDGIYPLETVEITKLHEQTAILSRLVTDLHDLSQADAGQLRLERRPIDLARLVRETVDAFGPLAEAEDVRFDVQAPTGRSPAADNGEIVLEVDPDRLRQVLHNLLGNALRHAPAGSAVEVRLRTTPVARDGRRSDSKAPREGVEILVSDAGSGIAAEDVAHVFDRFFRGDRSRTRGSGGSGLGLAIARALVKAHGGDITVASPGDERWSTTFTVRLPLSSTAP
jgi:signal transduction histidine kinase